jgi:hypothetical protein
MTYNNVAEPRELCYQHSSDSLNQRDNSHYDSLLQWPSNSYFSGLQRDTALFKEILTPYTIPAASTVADQVFGSQARQQKLGLRHSVNTLYERALLHAKHLKEINRALMQCHEKLSILKMHFPVDAGRSQQNLERLVLQLEQERRTEEINFWKDTTEIRQQLFEGATEYGATKRRKEALTGVEG